MPPKNPSLHLSLESRPPSPTVPATTPLPFSRDFCLGLVLKFAARRPRTRGGSWLLGTHVIGAGSRPVHLHSCHCWGWHRPVSSRSARLWTVCPPRALLPARRQMEILATSHGPLFAGLLLGLPLTQGILKFHMTRE